MKDVVENENAKNALASFGFVLGVKRGVGGVVKA